MNVLVFIGPDRGGPQPESLSIEDQQALEASLVLAEPSGEITAVSVDDAGAGMRLGAAVEAGVHRVVQLAAESEMFLPLTLGSSIAAIMRERSIGVIVVRSTSGEIESCAVGPAVSAVLGCPYVGSVVDVRRDDSRLEVERSADGVRETLRLPTTPAVLGISRFAALRYPTLPNRLRARRTQPQDVSLLAGPIGHATTELPKPLRKPGHARLTGEERALAAVLGGPGSMAAGSGRVLTGDGNDVGRRLGRTLRSFLPPTTDQARPAAHPPVTGITPPVT
jgi:electron transfer flavoprotein beta subunit